MLRANAAISSSDGGSGLGCDPSRIHCAFKKNGRRSDCSRAGLSDPLTGEASTQRDRVPVAERPAVSSRSGRGEATTGQPRHGNPRAKLLANTQGRLGCLQIHLVLHTRRPTIPFSVHMRVTNFLRWRFACINTARATDARLRPANGKKFCSPTRIGPSPYLSRPAPCGGILRAAFFSCIFP